MLAVYERIIRAYRQRAPHSRAGSRMKVALRDDDT